MPLIADKQGPVGVTAPAGPLIIGLDGEDQMTEQIICAISNCANPRYKRIYCNAHYIRWRRHGDPLFTKRRTDLNNCGAKECPAVKKIRNFFHYLNNKDIYKKRAEDWRINNQDYYTQKKKEYFSREDIKQKARLRTKEWVEKNPERKREMDKQFYEQNRALVTSYKAKRRAAQKCATPSWLTQEQIEAIRDIYKEARRLTIKTGIQYEVDHIVPLDGRIVSGLHVPWNLRAIPKDENNRRPRIYMDN